MKLQLVQSPSSAFEPVSSVLVPVTSLRVAFNRLVSGIAALDISVPVRSASEKFAPRPVAPSSSAPVNDTAGAMRLATLASSKSGPTSSAPVKSTPSRTAPSKSGLLPRTLVRLAPFIIVDAKLVLTIDAPERFAPVMSIEMKNEPSTLVPLMSVFTSFCLVKFWDCNCWPAMFSSEWSPPSLPDGSKLSSQPATTSKARHAMTPTTKRQEVLSPRRRGICTIVVLTSSLVCRTRRFQHARAPSYVVAPFKKHAPQAHERVSVYRSVRKPSFRAPPVSTSF